MLTMVVMLTRDTGVRRRIKRAELNSVPVRTREPVTRFQGRVRFPNP